jgi:hypothetical protein
VATAQPSCASSQTGSRVPVADETHGITPHDLGNRCETGPRQLFQVFAVRTLSLEDHCVKANPERRTQEQAEENPSGGTTTIINVGIESRRFNARHGCDDTDPEGSLRLSASIRRHQFGCHTTDGATDTPGSHEVSSVHAFARGCAQVSGAHRVMARTRVAASCAF